MSILNTILSLHVLTLLFGQIITDEIEERIVNGQNVSLGEIPYVVSVQYKGSHWCGGVIINESYVLSTGSLFTWSVRYLQIVAGTTDLNDTKVVRQVVEKVVHYNYRPADFGSNDICLLKVDPPFEFGSTISAAKLPNRSAKFDGEMALVAGWGQIGSNEPTSRFLKKVDVPIVSNEHCSRVYKNLSYNIYHVHVCAYDAKYLRGSCRGDHGGPLLVNGTLVGLVSWGVNACASITYPTVHTRVSEFLYWIRLYTKN